MPRRGLSERLNTKKEAKVIPIDRDRRAISEQCDEELVRLARAEVAGAFDALVRRYQERALGAALRYLGDPSQAQDVAQNAFVEIYLYLPKYRPQGRFAAFFYRVLLNQCKMAARRRRSRSRGFDLPFRQLDAPSPAAAWANRRDLQRCINRLSEKLRAVIVLRYGAELTHEEIAATLEVPVGTVKSRLGAGLARIREMLDA